MIFHYNTLLNSGGAGKYFRLLKDIRNDQIFDTLGSKKIGSIIKFLLRNYQIARDQNCIKVFHSQITLIILIFFCRGKVIFIPHGIINGLEYLNPFRRLISIIILRIKKINVICCGEDEFSKALNITGESEIDGRIILLRNPYIHSQTLETDFKEGFLFCGPMISQKGLDRLISMVDNKYQKDFTIVTKLSLNTKYAKKIKMLFEKADFDVRDYLKITPEVLSKYRALVVCSRFEGMPFLVLEALAAGTSVLLPNVPGCRELHGYEGVITYDLDKKNLDKELSELLSSNMNEIFIAKQQLSDIYSYKDFNKFWINTG